MDILVLEVSEIFLHLYVKPVDFSAKCGDGGTDGGTFVPRTGTLLCSHFRQCGTNEVCLLMGVGERGGAAERSTHVVEVFDGEAIAFHPADAVDEEGAGCTHEAAGCWG